MHAFKNHEAQIPEMFGSVKEHFQDKNDRIDLEIAQQMLYTYDKMSTDILALFLPACY